MLDVALQRLSFRHKSGFALHDISVTFPLSTHTAILGTGSTTLLRLIAGQLSPSSGEIVIGQRRVTNVKASARPLLHVDASLEVPARWSVQHALIAAVRSRSLDRIDRHREYSWAAGRWQLDALLERKIATLSATEQLRVRLARIELLRPAIVVADRLLERAAPSDQLLLADAIYRLFRVMGTTVISAPASRSELAFADSVVVLDEGRLVQQGSPAAVFSRPESEAAALATGETDAIPVVIRGRVVESAIGSWEVAAPPFQGDGVALVRPGDFRPAARGEESDFIFGIEEAGFVEGRWLARGYLSGGDLLRVELPAETAVHKGKVLALRYDPTRFRLVPRAATERRGLTVPTDVIPSRADSR